MQPESQKVCFAHIFQMLTYMYTRQYTHTGHDSRTNDDNATTETEATALGKRNLKNASLYFFFFDAVRYSLKKIKEEIRDDQIVNLNFLFKAFEKNVVIIQPAFQ